MSLDLFTIFIQISNNKAKSNVYFQTDQFAGLKNVLSNQCRIIKKKKGFNISLGSGGAHADSLSNLLAPNAPKCTYFLVCYTSRLAIK